MQVQTEIRCIVEYSPRFGGVCPCGNINAKVRCTRPWMGNIRFRSHLCEKCGRVFQSRDVDRTHTAAQILAVAMN